MRVLKHSVTYSLKMPGQYFGAVMLMYHGTLALATHVRIAILSPILERINFKQQYLELQGIHLPRNGGIWTG